LWLEPGLGKTKIAIDFCSYYFNKGLLKRVVIVCPLSIIGVWEDEIAKHCSVPFKICTGPFEPLTDNVLQFYITSYGYMSYRNRDNRKWRHLEEFFKLKPECVIADEAHGIKTHTSNRTKAVRLLCKDKPFILQLTGTPQPNNALDLYSPMEIISPGIFGKWVDFKNRYAVYDFNGFKVIKWLNLDELKKKIQPHAIRIRKDDALELPERTHQIIPVNLQIIQKDAYERMKKESYLRLSEKDEVTADIVLTQYLRLQQITGGFTVTDKKEILKVGEAKDLALETLLPTYTSGKGKIVIFCRFLEEIRRSVEVANRLKLNPLQITGGMSKDERDKARVLFQENSKCKVLVLQIATGGCGITLHRANTAIFYSLTFNSAEHEQACDRIHRIGQKEKCLYLYLLGRCTIDEYIYKSLIKKQKLADLTVNWREVLK